VKPKSDDHVALGRAIRRLRDEQVPPLSQEKLAERAGTHRTYVGGIERGERNFSFEKLLRLAAALDVDASELLRRYEAQRRPGPTRPRRAR
jgi:transcriptional regulator with XRE-family HTH domain